MSIRYYHPRLLFEVTARTIAGAFLFDPVAYPGFAAAFHAIIAMAQKRHGVRIYAYFAMSNHYHAIYGADDPDALADFLCDVHGNMARYANRVLGRVGPVFCGRCDVTPILPGEKGLSERVCYIMGQAIKAHERWTLDNWPGANTNRALLYGEPLVGKHFDRHQKTLDARRKAGPQGDDAYTSEHVVTVSPLPGWETLPEPELRARYRALADEAAERFAANPGASAEGGTVQGHDDTGQFAPGAGQEAAGPAGAEAKRGAPPASTSSEAPAAGPSSAEGPGGAPAITAERAAPSADPEAAALTPQQKAWMRAARPKPKKREHKRARRPEAYADSEAQVARYCEAYKAIREAHIDARVKLQEQAERALRGKRAKAVQFPLYTFAAVARTGRLAFELGKVAGLGEAA